MAEYQPAEYQRLVVRQYPVNSLRQTPEGKFWKQYRTPTAIQQFGPVSHIDFCPTYPYTFAVTAATRVVTYNPVTRQAGRTFTRFKDTATSGVFRGDGRLLAAGGVDGVLQVFDAGSRGVLRQCRGHKRPVHVVRWAPDRLHLLSGGDDVTVRWWDVGTGQQLTRFDGHLDYVRAACVSPNSSETWATGGYDHVCRLWDVRVSGRGSDGAGGGVMQLEHGAPIEDCVFLPSGSLLVTAGGNHLCVWDLVGGAKLLHRISNFQKTVTCLAVSQAAGPAASAAPRLLAGSLDGHVKVIELDQFKTTHASRYPGPVLSLGLSPDCGVLAVGMADGTLSVRRHAKPRPVTTGVSAKPQKRTHYAPRLTAANYRYFIRGQSEQASAADHVVVSQRWRKLRAYDKLLRRFRHKAALDAALATGRPDVVASVVGELAARGALQQAVKGRDGPGLERLLQFVVRYTARPRHTSMCAGLAHRLLTTYGAHIASRGKRVNARLHALHCVVAEELKVCNKLLELQGMLEPLLGAALSA